MLAAGFLSMSSKTLIVLNNWAGELTHPQKGCVWGGGGGASCHVVSRAWLLCHVTCLGVVSCHVPDWFVY